MRRASSLVAILALLLGQAGAQLHDLTHLKHDLGVIRDGAKKAPPLGHSIEVCVAYASICNATGHAGAWPVFLPGPPAAVLIVFLFCVPLAPRIHFLSRAPPALLRP
ncbi:MAG TPA: hypothetical protein VLX30_15850 [Burkholderiales bacterium]|nr:hypothetical protein [Burkholderiales bacterium]